jgi:hypothetical protein
MQAVLFRGANVMLVWHELGAIFIIGFRLTEAPEGS